jgi:protein-disulfide isomerase
MKRTFGFAFTVVVAALLAQGVAAQQQRQQRKNSSASDIAPVAVEVVAVDPQSKTITVRDIAAVPATPGKAVEITLPVPASATGKKLGDVKVGQKVDVTCAVKPTVHPTAGVPIVLTDCASVMRIDPTNK